MKLRVLFFSLLRDVTGCEESERTIAGRDSLTVAELLESLYTEWPGLRKWDEKILIAADHDYVTRDDTLTDGQEVAVMPPVQGG